MMMRSKLCYDNNNYDDDGITTNNSQVIFNAAINKSCRCTCRLSEFTIVNVQ